MTKSVKENIKENAKPKRGYENSNNKQQYGKGISDDVMLRYLQDIFGSNPVYAKEYLCPECKQLGQLCTKHQVETAASGLVELVSTIATEKIREELPKIGTELLYAGLAYKIASELDNVEPGSYRGRVLRALGAMYASKAGLDEKIFGYDHSAQGYQERSVSNESPKKPAAYKSGI